MHTLLVRNHNLLYMIIVQLSMVISEDGAFQIEFFMEKQLNCANVVCISRLHDYNTMAVVCLSRRVDILATEGCISKNR